MEKISGKDDGVENNANGTVPKEEDTAEDTDFCVHCNSDPCVVVALEEMLEFTRDHYMGWKTNRQIRFIMYRESVQRLYGMGLGKGVRKKLPDCVENKVRSMLPDDNYTGFIDSSDVTE